MAVLTSPEFGDGAALIASANIMPGGVAIFGPVAQVLASPAVNQLIGDDPVPQAGLFVWQRSIVDSAGNVLSDARVDVRFAETNATAEIFLDREGVDRKPNPFIVDGDGFARFYAQAGLYKIIVTRAGLERTYEDVLLGIRLDDIPALDELVTPIVEDLIEPTLEQIAETLDAIPQLVYFSVSALGAASGPIPDGWTVARTGVGNYRVTHGLSTTNYHPKLTVWDPSGDRVFSAMMVDKQINYFDYRVRSIHDEASATDSQVDVELTIA